MKALLLGQKFAAYLYQNDYHQAKLLHDIQMAELILKVPLPYVNLSQQSRVLKSVTRTDVV